MTTQKTQGACNMINYVAFRQELGKFDVSLKGFQETVDLAVEQHAKAFMPKMPMFADKEDITQAYADAESAIKYMGYDEIYKLACDACICVELSIDKNKEEDNDPFAKDRKSGYKEGE